jgi:hypothetical protein
MQTGLLWYMAPMMRTEAPLLLAAATSFGPETPNSADPLSIWVSTGTALGPPGMNFTDSKPTVL